MDDAEAATNLSFSDWHIPTSKEAVSIFNFEAGGSGMFPEFVTAGFAFAQTFWTATTVPTNTTQAYRIQTAGLSGTAKTNPLVRAIYCRNHF